MIGLGPSEERRLALGFLALGVLAWLVPAGIRRVGEGGGVARPSCRVVLPVGWRGLLHGRPLELNRAGAEDLQALDGVGPATARAIIDDRGARGPFRRVDDLIRVPGVGPKTLKRLRPFLRVDGDPVVHRSE